MVVILKFFLGKLNPTVHPYFADIYQMRVSAHCFSDRLGQITQFVNFNHRAWHTGLSEFQGRQKSVMIFLLVLS